MCYKNVLSGVDEKEYKMKAAMSIHRPKKTQGKSEG